MTEDVYTSASTWRTHSLETESASTTSWSRTSTPHGWTALLGHSQRHVTASTRRLDFRWPLVEAGRKVTVQTSPSHLLCHLVEEVPWRQSYKQCQVTVIDRHQSRSHPHWWPQGLSLQAPRNPSWLRHRVWPHYPKAVASPCSKASGIYSPRLVLTLRAVSVLGTCVPH